MVKLPSLRNGSVMELGTSFVLLAYSVLEACNTFAYVTFDWVWVKGFPCSESAYRNTMQIYTCSWSAGSVAWQNKFRLG